MAALAAPALASPQDRYYERAFILAADERCNLFRPELTAALNAAAWQARGASLRAGADERAVADTAARARARAAGTSCASADLRTVSGRVENAFVGWSRTARMTFPGDRASWTADRSAYVRPTWRLMQAASADGAPVRFGVVGALNQADRLAAVTPWPQGERPTAARLVLRDREVAPRPWLIRALPPGAQRKVVWASGVHAAAPTLLAEASSDGQVWTFPASGAHALVDLDPREVFSLEFVFRDGSVRRATFEVGDFAAGRAFLAMGRL